MRAWRQSIKIYPDARKNRMAIREKQKDHCVSQRSLEKIGFK